MITVSKTIRQAGGRLSEAVLSKNSITEEIEWRQDFEMFNWEEIYFDSGDLAVSAIKNNWKELEDNRILYFDDTGAIYVTSYNGGFSEIAKTGYLLRGLND